MREAWCLNKSEGFGDGTPERQHRMLEFLFCPVHGLLRPENLLGLFSAVQGVGFSIRWYVLRAIQELKGWFR